MKKLTFLTVAWVCAELMGAGAAAADDPQPAKLYYDDGVVIETPQLDMRLNFLLQPRFRYLDADGEAEAPSFVSDAGSNDTSSFEMRRAEIEISGNAMNKGFSYMLENDFADDDGGSELEDAWIQWNSDGAKLRLGQTRIPYSRQERVSNSALQFPERSIVSDTFSPKRELGAMFHGAAGDSSHYYVGAFNGESTVDGEEEGVNRPGLDNNLLFAAAIDYTSEHYGSRGYEGDLRAGEGSGPGEFGFTAGVSLLYGEGEGGSRTSLVDSPIEDDLFDGVDFKKTALNGDLGVRWSGISLQGELYYSHLELDLSDDFLGGDEGDDYGFYTQLGWMLREDLEIALRYGYLDQDEDLAGAATNDEYSVGVNYYIDGHKLKVQTAITWSVVEYAERNGSDDNDRTDVVVDSQLTGEF